MTEEKRRHLRLPAQSKVFIELVSAAAGSDEPGEVATCNAIELSRGGFRVSVEQELPVEAVLQIGVELPGIEQPLYLAGEVKWCMPEPGPGKSFSAGFQLLNAANSDIDRWEAQLRSMTG